ncbi:MAG: hypothetical protein ACOYB1_15700 [Limnohabitans sp.]
MLQDPKVREAYLGE